MVRIENLDLVLAKAAGECCGRRGTADLIDASVAVTAMKYGGLVATSDPDDLHQLDPSLTIVRV